MKNYRVIYTILIYVVFFVLFCIVGLVNTFITDNPVVLQILKTLLAWTSFWVLLAMFKKLLPDKTLAQFIRELFDERLNLKIFFSILIVQFALFAVSLFWIAARNGNNVLSYLNFSLPSIISGFFVQLVGGPLGEEPAYRGFAQPHLARKYGVIRGSLILGILWGMWHFPLWLISGYKGTELILYCVFFLVSIVSSSVVMGIVYYKNKNIINPILIHFLVNFTLDTLYKGDLLSIFGIVAVLYLVATVIISLLFYRGQHSPALSNQ